MTHRARPLGSILTRPTISRYPPDRRPSLTQAFWGPIQKQIEQGSGVIIPVRHAETVFDLTPEEIDATFALLKHVKAMTDEQYHPDGYNVGWNCLAVGGQIAMHAHMHVIPRFRQEPYAGRGIRYWLKQPANRWW